MVPAIYTDVSDDKSSCGLVQGIAYVGIIDAIEAFYFLDYLQGVYSNAMVHLFLVSVLPYLIPFAAMIYPIVVSFRALRNAEKEPQDAEDLDPEDQQKKDDLRCS